MYVHADMRVHVCEHLNVGGNELHPWKTARLKAGAEEVENEYWKETSGTM